MTTTIRAHVVRGLLFHTSEVYMQLAHVTFAVVVIALIGSTGCGRVHGDPGGPGATGNVALEAGLVLDGFAALELRAFPDAGDELIVPETEFPPHDERVELATVGSFPFSYELTMGIGTTDTQEWRVLAWLTSADESLSPTESEPAGTATFLVRVCSPEHETHFCGTTDGIDLTIRSR